METTNLNCEVTHETAAGTMTCRWIDNRVKMVEHFALAKTYVLIDEQVKATYDDLTFDEFFRLQCECQRVANDMMKEIEKDLPVELRISSLFYQKGLPHQKPQMAVRKDGKAQVALER